MPTGTVWHENGEAGGERGGGEAGWIRIVIVLSHLSSCCMLSPLLHAVGLFFGHPGNHDDSSETSVPQCSVIPQTTVLQVILLKN